MTRLLPVITCVFVVATLVSSCARDCGVPEAAQRPPGGVDYGSGPPPQPYGQSPGSYPSGPPPGSYPYGPPAGAPPYGPPPGSSCRLIDADRRDGGQDLAFDSHRIRFFKSLLFHARGRCAGWLFERGIRAQGRGEDRNSSSLNPQSDGSSQRGPCSTGPHPHL